MGTQRKRRTKGRGEKYVNEQYEEFIQVNRGLGCWISFWGVFDSNSHVLFIIIIIILSYS